MITVVVIMIIIIIIAHIRYDTKIIECTIIAAVDSEYSNFVHRKVGSMQKNQQSVTGVFNLKEMLERYISLHITIFA